MSWIRSQLTLISDSRFFVLRIRSHTLLSLIINSGEEGFSADCWSDWSLNDVSMKRSIQFIWNFLSFSSESLLRKYFVSRNLRSTNRIRLHLPFRCHWVFLQHFQILLRFHAPTFSIPMIWIWSFNLEAFWHCYFHRHQMLQSSKAMDNNTPNRPMKLSRSLAVIWKWNKVIEDDPDRTMHR